MQWKHDRAHGRHWLGTVNATGRATGCARRLRRSGRQLCTAGHGGGAGRSLGLKLRAGGGQSDAACAGRAGGGLPAGWRRRRFLRRAGGFLAAARPERFPAWETAPGEARHPRRSPRRSPARAEIAECARPNTKLIVTSIQALLQPVPPRELLEQQTLRLRVGDEIDPPRCCAGSPKAVFKTPAPSSCRANSRRAAASSTCSPPIGFIRCGSNCSATRWNRSDNSK